MKFFIVSERKLVPINGHTMGISYLVRYWLQHLQLGYRMVDTYGGYVTQKGEYIHEPSFELTVNAPMSALPKLKLLARCIARLANQEEVWIEFGKNTLKITSASNL